MDEQAQASQSANGLSRKPTLVPTLIVGLGGTGVGTLRAFKRRLRQAWNIPPMEEGPGIIQLLGVDTVPWTNPPGEEYLHRHEYAYIGGYNAAQVLRHLENHPTVKSWWNWDAQAVPIGQIHSGARQTRCVGRLSLFRRYRTFWNHLQPKLNDMASVSTIEEVENLGFPVVREGGIRHVYVVSSLCGGTGSGIFLDVAHKLRDVLHEQAIITGILALPSVFLEDLDSDLQKARIQANSYAALKELDYFQGGNDFEVQYPGEASIVVSRPFDRIYLMERRNRRGEVLSSIDDVMEMIGHQIFLESVSQLGSHIWAYDVNITQERGDSGQSLLAYSSFATSSLVVPQERMQEYSALKYTERLIELGLLRDLTPADMNALDERSASLIAGLDDVLHGRYMQSREEGAQTPVARADWDDEEEWDDEAQAAPAYDEEADEELSDDSASSETWSADSYQSLLDELRVEIHAAARRYGLKGSDYFVRSLHTLAASNLQSSRSKETELTQRIDTLENRLRNVRDPFITNLLNFWPFDMLFVNNIKQSKQQERVILRDQLSRLEHDLQTEQLTKSVWTRLVPIFESLVSDVESRIAEVETATSKGLREAMGVFFRLRRRSEQEIIFNLSSDAVDESYIINEFELENWRRVLSRRLDDSLEQLVGDPRVFEISITLAERRALLESSFSETLVLRSDIGPLLGEGESHPLNWRDIYSHVLAHSRDIVNQSIPGDEYHLGSILASNRSMLGERFKQLFARCYPFWRYDLDKGGFDEQDLEHTILVGVDDDVQYVKIYDQLLRDYTEFERVSTGDPTRIEACRIEHGLPVSYLESMSTYYGHYQDFLKRGPLHLDARWQAFPDIVLPSDLASNGLQPENRVVPVKPSVYGGEAIEGDGKSKPPLEIPTGSAGAEEVGPAQTEDPLAG